MKLVYVIYLILSCDTRKGHFLPKFGKTIVLLKSIHEGIITNSRNSVRLLTTTSYLKKMKNLIYGYMLYLAVA